MSKRQRAITTVDDIRVQFRFSRKEHDLLEDFARSRGIPLNTAMRILIATHLDPEVIAKTEWKIPMKVNTEAS